LLQLRHIRQAVQTIYALGMDVGLTHVQFARANYFPGFSGHLADALGQIQQPLFSDTVIHYNAPPLPMMIKISMATDLRSVL